MQSEQRRQLKEVQDAHKAAQKRKRDAAISQMCAENVGAAEQAAVPDARAVARGMPPLPAELAKYSGDPNDRCALHVCSPA